ncbi:MAG: sulfite exporter TauE/SafE family protein [Actinomycetota bacterium]
MSSPSVGGRTAAIVGVAAGLLGGMFGVGGGLIIVPGLVSFAGMERRMAHGTSLAATLPIAAASLLTYIATGNVDWPLALFLAIGAIGGAFVGTHLLQIIPKRALTILFIAVVIATAFRLLLTDSAGGRGDLTVIIAVGLVLVGLITGTLAGLLGIGGGIVMVPAMVVLLDEIPVVAKGTSAAVIVPTAIMGTIRNRQKANADMRVATFIGGFGVVSAVAGGLIANQLSTQASNIMFAALLVFVAVTQTLSLRSESRAAQ